MIRRTEPNMSFGHNNNNSSRTIPSKQRREEEGHSPRRLSPPVASARNDDNIDNNKGEGPKATPNQSSSGSNSSTGTPKTIRTASSASSSAKRRSSTFYVPLNEDCLNPNPNQDSADEVYSLDLSACSFDWSLNGSVSSEGPVEEKPLQNVNCGGAIAKKKTSNDPEDQSDNNNRGATDDHQTSTPIKLLVTNSRTRTNILNLADRISLSPLKEKSKTLPQNLNNSAREATFPAKSSLLLKSSPKISTMNDGPVVIVASASPPPQIIPLTAKSPRKSLSFIRRSHSTKVSRSSSLLRSFKQGEESTPLDPPAMIGLNAELLERLYKITVPEDFDESLRRVFFKERRSEAGTANSSFTAQAATDRGSGSKRRPEEEEGGRSDREEDGFHSGNNYRSGSLCFEWSGLWILSISHLLILRHSLNSRVSYCCSPNKIQTKWRWATHIVFLYTTAEAQWYRR